METLREQFGKPGRDSEKPRENAPVTAGKSSGISHANLEERQKKMTTTTSGKLREDSSAITGKARKKRRKIRAQCGKTTKTVRKIHGRAQKRL